MSNYQITMTRGDTLSFGLEFEGLNRELDTACFTVKEHADDRILFQRKLGQGITTNNGTQYIVRISPENTENIEPKQYHFDLEITVGNDVFTIMKGILDVESDVTFKEDRS